MTSASGYHAVHFYNDARSLQEIASPFLSEGIKTGRRALIIATDIHASAIVAAMRRMGLDVDALKATGTLVIRDARATLSSLMVAGRVDEGRYKKELGGLCTPSMKSSTRAYGEIVDLLCQAGNIDDALRVETWWSQLAATYDIPTICGYSINYFHNEDRGGSGFADVCQLHSHVLGAIPPRAQFAPGP